ncbi:VIT domain-containing protein [Variovorax rhizosphaerae]|uniref:VIT domain-containing protein n=1 Tax=Variovorax rhizosphaerae TaxID=1836200 RepID=A0ABU8WZA0_9BURK
MRSLQEAACLKSRTGAPVLLEGVRAEGDVRGALFEMSVEQRFSNPTDTHIEVVYTFPLPWGAVLLGVEVTLGDRKLSGTVVEKKEAEATYEKTLAAGDAAIMLEKNRDQSYSLNLGNLAAGESCTVRLRHVQLLKFEQRGLRLLVPTVIAPRYGNAVADGGLQPHQVPVHDVLAEYPFDISLRVHGDLARARVASPSHPTSVSTRDGVLTVALARRGALDRDFVLVVDELAQDAVGVQGIDAVVPGQVAALASFCPRIAGNGPRHVAVKMLVDCSGSMAGDSIDAARRALQAIVHQLQPEDRFSLSRFGSTVQHRSRGLWAVTEVTRLAAQRWVGDLQADLGGTEMEAALASTFALASGEGGDVLLVTDGEIHGIDATIAAARKSGHRVFAVGVGSSPAESHLRRLAESTGGACDFVAAGEVVEPAVLRMFARLRSPRVTGMAIEWPGEVRPGWVSALDTAVFDADTVSVFALLPAALAGTVRLTGVRADGVREVIGEVLFAPMPEATDVLARLAASVRVDAMQGSDETKAAAALAVDYQLVTAGTNFLLVHARADGEKAMDMPELHQVAPMVPAGWGGAGAVAASHRAAPTRSMSPRMRNYAARVNVMAGPTGDIELPAFLRRATDDDRNLSMERVMPYSAGGDNMRYAMLDKAGGDGLTPFELQKALRLLEAEALPRNYADLLGLGVGRALVEWLQLTVGPTADERAVVDAFVRIMADVEFPSELFGDCGLTVELDEVGQKLAASLLPDMSESLWPDAVY